jgi:PmbA protein
VDKVLRIAREKGFSAELFHREWRETRVMFENSTLSSISSSIQCGYALRIRKGGWLGFSYCKAPEDPGGLLARAEASMAVRSGILFPEGHGPYDLETYDSSAEYIDSSLVAGELQRACSLASRETGGRGQCNASAVFGKGLVAVVNTNGLDVFQRVSFYRVILQLLFPHSQESLKVLMSSTGFLPLEDEKILRLSADFIDALPQIEKPTSGMDVILSPYTMQVLLWRLSEAASAASLYQGSSRLKGKEGSKIFSSRLSVYDNPRIKGRPDSRWFDDEGVPTGKTTIIDKGVFCSFFSDLDHAWRMGIKPTGNGYRTAMWGGDPVSLRPVPDLRHLTIEPGDQSLGEMLFSSPEAVLIEGMMGGHSGNIPNGDFSVGLHPGLYVRDGRIRGRLKGAMFSGNIYEVLLSISAVGDRCFESEYGLFPYLSLRT